MDLAQYFIIVINMSSQDVSTTWKNHNNAVAFKSSSGKKTLLYYGNIPN